MNVIKNKEISIGARLLYLYLKENKNNENEVREKGIRKISTDIGIDIKSVVKYLKELEKYELIKRTTTTQNVPQTIKLI